MGIFDPAIFDPAIFDTGAAAAATARTGGGAYWRWKDGRLRPWKPEDTTAGRIRRLSELDQPEETEAEPFAFSDAAMLEIENKALEAYSAIADKAARSEMIARQKAIMDDDDAFMLM